ncbi:MAG: succinylglutamate desuccinylase, partial [Opitutaceae bacterium]|nr:succinylglutamate desuccinylase [Opitutaceae bacterium]
SLLQSGFFDSGPAWTLCPVLNPDGLANKTRENAAGIDLNREYRNPTEGEVIAHLNFLEKRGEFDLTICLHEDWESTGFYLYELTHKKRIPLGSEIIQAVSQTDPIESSELIDGFVAENGIITPKENLEERELWPEALTLISSHTEHSCTLESPSSATLATRIRMLTTACKVACRITCDESL